MSSPWLGIGAETDPLRRARQLQRSWERLLADGALGRELPPGATVGLRATIVESWRRSLATGLDPTDSLAPIEADESEVLERWFDHPLGSFTHVLTEQLRKLAEESQSVVAVTDASGLVLHRMGDEWLKERAAEQNHLVEGARWSEAADGTNGIGTALVADHAFQVFACEHFNERHHQWICSAAPVHDPVSGQTIGLIDLSSLWKIAHPRSLELVTTAARTIEQCLLEVRRDRDARLRRRYGDLMTRSTDLLVNRDGYVLAGAERELSKTLSVPEGGGEVVLGDRSVAVAASLGQGEAYLLRRVTARHAMSAPVEVLERAEKHVRELVTEQSALRQVATLVARESAPDQLFAAVAEQVARVFAVPHVRLVRYEPEDSVVVGGFSEGEREPFPIGSRWPLDSPGVIATVWQTGRPARVEDYAHMTGEIATAARAASVRSTVASPIVVERRLWGAMVVLSPRHEPFPESTEARLTDFTELVATAIANAESRAAVARLADEQEALRRVATLVAQAAAPAEIYAAVSAEVDRGFGLDPATFDVAVVGRFDPGPELVVVGLSKSVEVVPLGSRWPPDELFAPTHVLRTGRSARIRPDDLASAGGEIAEFLRQHGYRSQVASPIVVEGRVWGAMSVNASNDFPPDTEERLERFTELVATAIANAESRDALTRIADQQAALRRVATLVARGARPTGAGPEPLFRAVAHEVQALLRSDVSVIVRFEDEGTATTLGTHSGHPPAGTRHRLDPNFAIGSVRRAGHAARFETDDPSAASMPAVVRENGVRSAVASPIVVEGEVWGAICVGSLVGSLPPGTEARLADFTELVATAIANAESRDALGRLVDEQAALRRVATLVARDAPPGEVFDVVAMEAGKLLDTDITVVGRYDGDGSATAIGSWSASPGGVPVGTRSVLGGRNVLTLVAETERPARVEGYDDASGEAADIARRHGWRSSIAAPIIVEGRLWGVMLVATKRLESFPAGAEERLAAFTDLLATALANAQAHDELRRFGDEQAALGRVATLVAAGSAPGQVFTAVVEEVSSLLGLERIELVHYNGDVRGTVIASSGGHPFLAGTTWSLDDPSVMATVARTRRAARVDDYTDLKGEVAQAARGAGFQSAIGAPITVEGSLWGVIIAISTDPEPIPERSEARLGQFTELVATAVANAEARDALAQLADEQAALRRVATLVAHGVQPEAIFSAVGEEIGRLFGSSITTVGRFEPDAQALVVLGVGTGGGGIRIGSRWELDDVLASAQVFRSGRSVRVDEADWSAVRSPLAQIGRRFGVASTVASPIFVEGRLWGVVSVSDDKPLPQEAEERLEKFSELIATAIANAEGSAELAASRRRIVAAADEARRRIERDLHDGIQQRLIALTFRARAMTRKQPDELPDLAAELAEGLKDASDDLREVSRGIHPTILTEAGLGPALRALARRSNVPIDVDVRLDERLPAPVEAAAYYIASEALTNVAKHAQANVVELIAAHDNGALAIEIRDDGIGGVDANRGSGILGLTDRVEALGGTISIASPPHGGTTLSVRLPVVAT